MQKNIRKYNIKKCIQILEHIFFAIIEPENPYVAFISTGRNLTDVIYHLSKKECAQMMQLTYQKFWQFEFSPVFIFFADVAIQK